MKRKVRIYKDPNGNGGYINKTAQWLRKADEGIQTGPTPVTQGIMQQMQAAQPQQMQQQPAEAQEGDVMLQETTQMISRGMDKEDIKANLLAKYANYEPGTAEYEDAESQVDQYLEGVYDQLGETARDETNQRLELEDAEEYQDPADVAVAEEETNPNYYYDLAQEDSADSDMEEDYDFARYGGVPNKRSYINKTIRQLRKAQKGDQVEEANTADVRGTEDNPTAPPGNNNMFVAGVKGQAENHFLKQQAEQMYNNQFGQGMPQPDMQQPQGDMDFAQRGGFRMRRANRRMFGSPNLPFGVTSSKYSFGPLGGVRSAEVQFNPLMMASMASMFPMMSFPGMGGFSSYGYQTPKKKYTTGRLVTEKVATNVNNKSTEDVAKATGSDAAKSSEKFDVVVGDPGKKVEFTPGEGEIVPVKNSRSIANTWSQPHPELALQQMGGFISNPTQDQFGNLQKFVYGGDEMNQMFLEDLYQPPINQSDLDDTDSKDVTDAYFRYGGLHRYAEGGEDETEGEEPKTYSKEELDKLIAEKQKSWETDYQNKIKQQQPQYPAMQQYMNPMGSRVSGYGYRGAPMGGFGGYGGPGLLGAAGRLAGSFMGGRQSQFSPVGNPLQYAATAAGITKAGMLPTGMKYSKEKKQDGNFFERKLGFNKDKVWTIDYATPEQIKAGVKPGTTPGAAPGMAGSQQDKSKGSLKDKAMNLKERFLNRNTPAEADAEAFTGTLKGSTEPKVPSKSADQELARFQESQKAKGLVLDPKTQKWVKGETLNASVMNTPSGITSSQGADMVTGTPGTAVNLGSTPSATQPSEGSKQTLKPGDAINGMVESPGMVGKSPEEIKEALRKGESIPTVVNKGNTTYINAAGNPIDLNDPVYSDTYAYGGYIPSYMAYGGYIPEADQGINVSSVAYEGNPVVGVQESPTWSAMQYFNQNQNIKNPDADKFKNYTVEPEGEDLSTCTDEQKKDPTSKCYEPQTAQLKIKEEKGPAGQKAANIMGSALDTGALLADEMNYLTERRTKYIPGMTEFARGEKQTAEERINKGEFNARTGKEGIQGFEGIIRKGGAIKNKKSNASGHKIDMDDFQSLLKLAGLI